MSKISRPLIWPLLSKVLHIPAEAETASGSRDSDLA